ncbi:MAG: hypothetical protein HYU86_07785 [Chloroflexi bacterium]|nr:hypothetical protein [Chloroflexota bacterium]
MSNLVEKTILCRRCRRPLFSTVLVKGEGYCPRCKGWTSIAQARRRKGAVGD